MLTALKFVKGAVSAKDYQPALTHFLIKDGRVTGFDGIIALSSPIDLDIEIAPKALPFVKAIERCTADTIAVNLTEAGKLTLRSGRFRCTVECTEEKAILHNVQPEGEDVTVSGELVTALRVLEPFIGTDASRPWNTGVLLRRFSAYATNNIIVSQYWLGEAMPDINLPSSAIKELIRVGATPTRIQLSKNSATFHFEGDRWLRTQLLDASWPDIDSMFETAFDAENLVPLPDGFFEALETIVPFVDKIDGRIYFREDLMATMIDGAIGASMEITGLPAFGCYNHKMLALLKGKVDQIDFTKHPMPCPFMAGNLRGVFLGMVEE